MGSCLSGDGTNSVPYAQAPTSDVGTKRQSKKLRRNSSNDSKMEMWLHRVPGRLFLNGSTNAGSLFSRQGKKGINQDAMIFWENFSSKTDCILCGVFDGHGPNGHMVAKKVRDSLPLKLSAQWQLNTSRNRISDTSSSSMESKNSGESSSTSDDAETKSPLDYQDKKCQADVVRILKESFLKAFKVMDKELELHPFIDSYCSGTTAVTLIKQGQDLVIGNVGDSRAVLGARDKDGSLIAVQLTVDLKPNLPRESERIRLCKGRVFALQNEPEVVRMWLPDSDSPGLAMARAFGDFCLKKFGLISVPEISHHHLTDKDEFVVLATDGVWDVLSNQEVVDIVASAPRSSAARTVVEAANRAWKYKYPSSKVDDCAVVCLFISSCSDSSSSSYSTPTDQKDT